MNPLLNAYNYQIKKLTEEIKVLQKQNLLIEKFITEQDGSNNPFDLPGPALPSPLKPFDFPENQSFPINSPRGRFLQDLWEALNRLPLDDPRRAALYQRYILLRQMLERMSPSEWKFLRQAMQQYGPWGSVDSLLDLLNWLFDTQQEDVRDVIQRLLKEVMERMVPNLNWRQRAAKALGRMASKLSFGRFAIILLLLLQNIEAYGAEAIERWMRENENNPNPQLPDWWQGEVPWLPDVVEPSTEPEAPSMLPNTSPTAPELPGGGGGGFGPRPIDPGQLM